jgi:hypothetical protein
LTQNQNIYKKYDNLGSEFYRLNTQEILIKNSVSGLKEYLHVDFDSPLITCSLHGSLHSELISFQFKPGKLKISPEIIPKYTKEEHSNIFSSKNLEDYIAGVIKDKPVNIDKFFDYVVKQILERNLRVRKRLEDCLKIATDIGNADVVQIIEQSMESYLPHYSKEFREYIKWADEQKLTKPKQAAIEQNPNNTENVQTTQEMHQSKQI